MEKRKFRELSSEEQTLVVEQYNKNVPLKRIFEEFNLKGSHGFLYLDFPPTPTGSNCLHCGEPLMCKPIHRTVGKRDTDVYCPKCGHLPEYSYCDCDHCEENRRKIHAQKQNMIADTYTKRIQSVDFVDLSTSEKVYLAVAFRMLQRDETYEYFLLNWGRGMTPTSDMDRKLLQKLIDSHCFAVSPNADIEAFVEDHRFPYVYDPRRVKLWLTVESLGDEFETKLKLFDPDRTTFEKKELLKLWYEVGAQECLGYTLYVNEETWNVPSTIGCEKVFTELLEDFSICQVFQIIQLALTRPIYLDESDLIYSDYERTWLPRQINHYARKARLGTLKLNGLRRPDDYEVSELTYYLFNKATLLGERGFTMSPSLSLL